LVIKRKGKKNGGIGKMNSFGKSINKTTFERGGREVKKGFKTQRTIHTKRKKTRGGKKRKKNVKTGFCFLSVGNGWGRPRTAVFFLGQTKQRRENWARWVQNSISLMLGKGDPDTRDPKGRRRKSWGDKKRSVETGQGSEVGRWVL